MYLNVPSFVGLPVESGDKSLFAGHTECVLCEVTMCQCTCVHVGVT